MQQEYSSLFFLLLVPDTELVSAAAVLLLCKHKENNLNDCAFLPLLLFEEMVFEAKQSKAKGANMKRIHTMSEKAAEDRVEGTRNVRSEQEEVKLHKVSSHAESMER